jgi:RNA polymerase sigma-70 factor (ECF subfamily)
MPVDSALESALARTLASGATAMGATSARDEARLRKAFVQHYAGVWRFLRRLGVPADRADDAAQHTFLVALEALPRIVPGCERAFLYATAVRVAHGLRRRVDREVTTTDVDAGSSPLPTAEELTDQKRARELLDRLLGQIEIDARTAFVLFEIEGFTLPEIADLLKIPLGTATSRLRRARERFQELVQASSKAPGRQA